LGNGFTALFNKLIQNPDKTSKLTGVQYYVFFDALMLVTATVFIFVALRYKEQTYIQEQPNSSAS
jgi:POT family proton-dependent oligopeptide transporter